MIDPKLREILQRTQSNSRPWSDAKAAPSGDALTKTLQSIVSRSSEIDQVGAMLSTAAENQPEDGQAAAPPQSRPRARSTPQVASPPSAAPTPGPSLQTRTTKPKPTPTSKKTPPHRQSTMDLLRAVASPPEFREMTHHTSVPPPTTAALSTGEPATLPSQFARADREARTAASGVSPTAQQGSSTAGPKPISPESHREIDPISATPSSPQQTVTGRKPAATPSQKDHKQLVTDLTKNQQKQGENRSVTDHGDSNRSRVADNPLQPARPYALGESPTTSSPSRSSDLPQSTYDPETSYRGDRTLAAMSGLDSAATDLMFLTHSLSSPDYLPLPEGRSRQRSFPAARPKSTSGVKPARTGGGRESARDVVAGISPRAEPTQASSPSPLSQPSTSKSTTPELTPTTRKQSAQPSSAASRDVGAATLGLLHTAASAELDVDTAPAPEVSGEDESVKSRGSGTGKATKARQALQATENPAIDFAASFISPHIPGTL